MWLVEEPETVHHHFTLNPKGMRDRRKKDLRGGLHGTKWLIDHGKRWSTVIVEVVATD